MKKWYVVMIAIVIVLFGSVIGFNIFKERMIAGFIANRPEPIYPVTAMTVKSESWYPSIEAIGFIKPLEGVELGNEQGGKIVEINFKSGQKVKKGHLLVALNTTVERANLQEAEGQLPAVQGQLNRLKKLYQQNSVSKQSLDNAESKYSSLVAQIESLKATIQRRLIKAPFDGRVGIKNIYVGQYLPAGTNVIRLENTDTMHIQFTITQSDLSKVKKELPIKIFVDAYPLHPFSGKITAIEPAVNSDSGVIDVQASIPNNNGKLRSGMYARVIILLPEEENQIAVPVRTINFQLYGQSVYVIKNMPATDRTPAYKVVNQMTVHVNGRNKNIARVVKGLKTGDQIVTSGQVRLSNGSHVKIVETNSLNIPDTTPQL